MVHGAVWRCLTCLPRRQQPFTSGWRSWVDNLSPPVIDSQNGIVNGAGFQAGISAGSWAAVQGTNLSYTTRSWQASDFVNGTRLPTSLDGVGVTVGGKPAYVEYVSPTQINFVVPEDSSIGPEGAQVTTSGVTSNTVIPQLQTFSPAFFLWNEVCRRNARELHTGGQPQRVDRKST